MCTKGYVYLFPKVIVKVEVDPSLSDAEMIQEAEEKVDLLPLERQLTVDLWSEIDLGSTSFKVVREPGMLHGKEDEGIPVWYMSDETMPQHVAQRTPELLTTQQVADRLRLQPNAVRMYARRGEIPAIKIAGHWRIRSDWLEQWISQQSLPFRR